MLIVELWSDPDDDVSVDAGGIFDRLPEVIVIRTGELILNDYFSSIVDDFSEDVDVVFADWFLSFNEFDIESNRIFKFRGPLAIELVSHPRREITLFVSPIVADILRLKRCEVWH